MNQIVFYNGNPVGIIVNPQLFCITPTGIMVLTNPVG